MAKRLLGFSDIQSSEAAAARATEESMPGLIRNYPGLLDIYVNLGYFMGENTEPKNSDASYLWFFAFQSYIQTPYTFTAGFDLVSRAYYSEALILIRNLTEILVQLRYFEDNSSALRRHYSGDRRVSFKKMFDALCPGFYQDYYGFFLSGVAHGKTTPFFRLDVADSLATPRLGCQFDRRYADFSFRNLLYLLYGYINHFPLFFPDNILTQQEGIQDDVEDAKRWIQANAIEDCNSEAEAAGRWFGTLRGLILNAD